MIEQLRHFLLIADTGTFTAAARRAHVSQPALTASIRRLETQLEARLLDRGRSGATLTEAGRVLLPHARAAVVAMEEGTRAVAALGALKAGEVKIGGGSTACSYLLPPLLAEFRRRFPGVSVRLRELPEELAVDEFEAGDLDIVVATGRRGELFRREDVVLVAPPQIDPETLPFLTFNRGSAVRTLLDRYFPEADIVMELSSIATVKASVRAGIGKALISRSSVASDITAGRLVEVPDRRTPIARPLSLIHRGVERLSAAALELRRVLLEEAPHRRSPASKRKALAMAVFGVSSCVASLSLGAQRFRRTFCSVERHVSVAQSPG
ncbi:MAG: LysR family transcriptional regulator [Polyangiaceae bacterium]